MSTLSWQLPKAHAMYIYLYADLCMYRKGVNSLVQFDGINTQLSYKIWSTNTVTIYQSHFSQPRNHACGYGRLIKQVYKAILNYKSVILFLTFIMLFNSVQEHKAMLVQQSVAPSVRRLVSHCLLHVDYLLPDLAILLLKFRKCFHRSMLQMLCSTT